MADFKTYKFANENPSASKAFVKSLSPYELLQVLDTSPDNHNYDIDKSKFIIDCDDVIDGIIESGCEGKLLLLAARSDLGSWSRVDKLINLIFSKGNPCQSALLSNPRINWYLFFLFDKSGFIERYLDCIIDVNSNLAPVFYRNPRMDRGLIAHIIRAGNASFKDSNYKFAKINAEQRLAAAYYSLPVEEIKTNYDDIDDSFGGPSANTTDFHKPIWASLFLIKDLSNKMPQEELSRRLTPLTYMFPKLTFSCDPEDWLSQSELRNLYESADFAASREKSHHMAMARIIEFFDEITADHKPSIEGNSADFPYYTLAFLSIVSLGGLLRNYENRSNFYENIEFLLKSSNWVLRAAAYSAAFRNIPITKDSSNEFELFLNKANKDPEASTHGIMTSYAYYLFNSCERSGLYSPASMLMYHFDKMSISDEMRKYFDRLAYIFDIYRSKNDILADINIHNQQVISKTIKEEERQRTGFFSKLGSFFRQKAEVSEDAVQEFKYAGDGAHLWDEKEVGVVICSNCGRKNRIKYRNIRDKIPICGNCKSRLFE